MSPSMCFDDASQCVLYSIAFLSHEVFILHILTVLCEKERFGVVLRREGVDEEVLRRAQFIVGMRLQPLILMGNRCGITWSGVC